jgi:hypothetical protein
MTEHLPATHYEVERDGVTIDTAASNSYSDTTVSPSTQYAYRVRAAL